MIGDIQAMLKEVKALERQGITCPRVNMAARAAKNALRHATIGQDVEKLTAALMDKAQELARLERLQDLASARRRLAIARASIWSPASTTAAIDSAGHALKAALDDLKERKGIRHVFPAMA